MSKNHDSDPAPMTAAQLIEASTALGSLPLWAYQVRRAKILALGKAPIIKPVDAFSSGEVVDTEPFEPEEHFKVVGGLVRMSFDDRFLRLFGKKIWRREAFEIGSFDLTKKCDSDRSFRTDLPGEHCTDLPVLLDLLYLQPSGQEGRLVTTGCANVFYQYSVQGEEWILKVRRSSDAWNISEESLSSGMAVSCEEGDRVFTRKPIGCWA